MAKFWGFLLAGNTRQGYANSFKPKTLKTRIGELNLQIPQVRGGVSFYPSAIERGVRSKRALKEQGLRGIAIITNDDHEGLKAALKATFPGAIR